MPPLDHRRGGCGTPEGRMNATCTMIAAASLILEGCYSYQELTHEEVSKGMIPPEVAIRITRTDGSVVQSGPYRHVLVQEPSDFIIGSGLNRKTGWSFSGTVSRSDIDSVREVRIKDPRGEERLYLLVWLSNQSSFAFEEYGHLDITPGHESGLWCAGVLADGNRAGPFKGRIDNLTIQKVEAERSSLFHPSPPWAGEDGGPIIQRMNLGLGFCRVSGDGAAAFLADYTLLSRSTLYSVRMLTTFTPPLPEVRTSPSLTEFAALYGVGTSSRFFSASAAVGVSYVRRSVRIPLAGGPGYRSDDFSTISFPIGLEVAITPFKYSGVAAKYFATYNSRISCAGLALCLQFEI